MKALHILSLSLLLGFVSCAIQQKDETNIRIKNTFPQLVSFNCEDMTADETYPKFKITLLMDGFPYTLDTITSCQNFAPSDFSNYEVPDSALAACGGWFAGSGDYFYATKKENVLQVYYGWQGEEQADEGFNYQVIKEFIFRP